MPRRHILERLTPDFGFFYEAGRTLHTAKTRYQHLEIIESREFGHALLLDGVTQVTTRNEFLYHEPMVHPALACHPRSQDVLVIGGGDGGILREVLRYNTVRKAVMAELDGGVVDFCAKHLPEISCGAFTDPRSDIRITDGRTFVEQTTERFDVVIMDMTDPFGPSVMLYTREFFQAVKNTFNDEDGIFVMHTESPISRQKTFQQCLGTLKSVFRYQRTFYLYVHMYATMWSVTVSSDGVDVGALSAGEITARLREREVSDLQCYTGATHHSMLTVMPFIQDLVDRVDEVPIITDHHPKVLDEIDLNRVTDLRLIDQSAP
jgi:spermidine synthase